MRLDLQIPEGFISNTESFDYKTPITSIFSKVKSLGAVVITKDGKYQGIIDNRQLSRKAASKLMNTSAGKLACRFPLIDSKVSIKNAINYFYDTGAKALPFIENKKIKGVVKREKMLEAMLSLHALSRVLVGEAMTTPVLAIDSGANIAEAVSTMRQKKINRLLVITNGKPSGILTQSDVAFTLLRPEERLPEMKADSHGLEGIEVGSVAEMYLYSIDFDRDIDSAIKQLIERNVSSLAVTRNGKTVGILTIRDIFKAVISDQEETIPVEISELDASTEEYKQEIIDSVKSALDRTAKFTKFGISRVLLTVKRSKNSYEIRARMILSRGKELTASSTGYTLETAVKQLCDRLYRLAEEKKDSSVTRKRDAERYYGEE